MRQGPPVSSVDGRRLFGAHPGIQERQSPSRMVTLSRDEAVGQLRGQASSCRRLARNSRTEMGSTALLTVACQFETDAFRIERHGQDDLNGHVSAQGRVRAALAQQGTLWPRISTSVAASSFTDGDYSVLS